MIIPSFAVVGHPNKGKSSIVSTLSQNTGVAIGPDPGTTIRAARFPMRVDGRTLYELIDTPGFQRARHVLHWLRAQQTTAAHRPEVVRRFCEIPEHRQQFPDELELLTPIASGAGILYVVDGSVPYGAEYEAEMEILRWTAQPSMALINPIGGEHYVQQWERALAQYFGSIRVFNPLMADFTKCTELLEGFGELRDAWREPLRTAAQLLRADRKKRIEMAAHKTAVTIFNMLTLDIEHPTTNTTDHARLKETLTNQYLNKIRNFEASLRANVEQLYAQQGITRSEPELAALDSDSLFSDETWKLFGLGRQEIFVLGALGGGAAGAVIDAALGGASFLLGTLLGGSLGAATALYSANSVATIRFLNLPLGSTYMIVGPTSNIQFPHIVFNRARLHHLLLAARTHAQRSALRLSEDLQNQLPPLEDGTRRTLERAFSDIRSARGNAESLASVITPIFLADAMPARR